MTSAVRNTAEFRRVRDLPRRAPAAVDLVTALTDLLSVQGRCPGVPQGPHGLCSVCDSPTRLHPIQALALHDIGVHRGLLGAIGVGEGKTLISLLAAYVLGASRPLLLLPAGLIEKTQRDREKLSKHWSIPKYTRLYSYEMLGRVMSAKTLDDYAPDLIICDEAHRTKNKTASCTRRLARYMSAHPETVFVALSGTLMSRSLLEFGHIAAWSLKGNSPLPLTQEDLDEWASALDEEIPNAKGSGGGTDFFRRAPGALLDLAAAEDLRTFDERTAARRGFRQRLFDTPGVVVTSGEGDKAECSLRISAIKYDLPESVQSDFAKLRKDWVAPADDYPLNSGAEIWFHAKALAIGVSYVWDPRPPQAWKDPRREWGSFVRETISRSRHLDSELQVAMAVQSGALDDGGALANWLAVKDTFVPNPVPVWHDDTVLRLCADWGKKPGIIWTEHAFFAERLAKETGMPYFGQQGLDADGAFIDDAEPKRAIIASIDANREGRNLQTKWSRNLIVSLPEGPGVVEQLLGRTFRKGQRADEVTVDVLLGCAEHDRAWRKVLAGSRATQDTVGGRARVLLADVTWPGEFEVAGYRGAQWQKTSKKDSDALDDW